MSGLLNSAPPAAAAPAGAAPMLNDPVLAAAEQKIEAQLDPDNRPNYMKIVVAGMAAALDKGPDGILASLRKSSDPVRDAAKGAIALVLILRRDAKGVMPLKAMIPAAMTLMLHALDFADRLGLVKVGNTELVRATHIFTNEIFTAFKITPAMLANATAKVHQITQDPVAMDAVHRKLGSVVAPGASQVTPGVR